MENFKVFPTISLRDDVCPLSRQVKFARTPSVSLPVVSTRSTPIR